MPYLIKTTAKEKDQLEPRVQEIPINPKNKTRLKNLLYVSYPYGAWFTQRLMASGKIKVSILDGDAFVDEEVSGADFECEYELIKIGDDDYKNKLKEILTRA